MTVVVILERCVNNGCGELERVMKTIVEVIKLIYSLKYIYFFFIYSYKKYLCLSTDASDFCIEPRIISIHNLFHSRLKG